MAPQQAGAIFSGGYRYLLEKETCLRVLDQPQVGAVSWSDTWDKGLLQWDGVGPDETGGYLNNRKHKSKNQVNLCWDYSFQVGCYHSAIWASDEILKNFPREPREDEKGHPEVWSQVKHSVAALT